MENATNVNKLLGPVVSPAEMAVIHAMEGEYDKREALRDAPGKGYAEKAGDPVSQPEHYKHGTFEVIDEMVLAFGLDATINFCILNAWKYRARAPYKGKMEQDLEKADRYMQYAHDLQLKKAKMDAAGGSLVLPLLMSSGKKPVAKQLDGEDKKHGPRR